MDLHDAFEATAAEENERPIALRVQAGGLLAHGPRIAAFDPLAGSERAFATVFPAGAHPVELLLRTDDHRDTRVALARIVFRRERPASFVLATRDGEDVRVLVPGQTFGYPVDAGTGCFADAGASFDGDALLAALQAAPQITWCLAAADPAGDGHRVVAFSSGFGDGIYSSWIGLDTQGEPVSLVTDFGCLEIDLPVLPDDPEFRAAHVTKRLAELRSIPLGGRRDGAAYAIVWDIGAMPDDAAHLARSVFETALFGEDRPAADLHASLGSRLLASERNQRVLADLLPSAPPERVARLLGGAGRYRLAPELATALLALPTEPPELRAAVLGALGSIGDDERATRVATEALEDDDEEMLLAALEILRSKSPSPPPLDPAVLARVAAVATSHASERVRRAARRVEMKRGGSPASALADPDPVRRLEAAIAVRDPTAQPVLVALARDPALTLEQRGHAAGRISDPDAHLGALLALGLEGWEPAAIQMRYVGGPQAVAALERLLAEARDPRIREQAGTWLERTRQLVDHASGGS